MSKLKVDEDNHEFKKKVFVKIIVEMIQVVQLSFLKIGFI